MLCARALAALAAESTVTVQRDDDASSSSPSTESTAEEQSVVRSIDRAWSNPRPIHRPSIPRRCGPRALGARGGDEPRVRQRRGVHAALRHLERDASDLLRPSLDRRRPCSQVHHVLATWNNRQHRAGIARGSSTRATRSRRARRRRTCSPGHRGWLLRQCRERRARRAPLCRRGDTRARELAGVCADARAVNTDTRATTGGEREPLPPQARPRADVRPAHRHVRRRVHGRRARRRVPPRRVRGGDGGRHLPSHGRARVRAQEHAPAVPSGTRRSTTSAPPRPSSAQAHRLRDEITGRAPPQPVPPRVQPVALRRGALGVSIPRARQSTGPPPTTMELYRPELDIVGTSVGSPSTGASTPSNSRASAARRATRSRTSTPLRHALPPASGRLRRWRRRAARAHLRRDLCVLRKAPPGPPPPHGQRPRRRLRPRAPPRRPPPTRTRSSPSSTRPAERASRRASAPSMPWDAVRARADGRAPQRPRARVLAGLTTACRVALLCLAARIGTPGDRGGRADAVAARRRQPRRPVPLRQQRVRHRRDTELATQVRRREERRGSPRAAPTRTARGRRRGAEKVGDGGESGGARRRAPPPATRPLRRRGKRAGCADDQAAAHAAAGGTGRPPRPTGAAGARRAKRAARPQSDVVVVSATRRSARRSSTRATTRAARERAEGSAWAPPPGGRLRSRDRQWILPRPRRRRQTHGDDEDAGASPPSRRAATPPSPRSSAPSTPRTPAATTATAPARRVLGY